MRQVLWPLCAIVGAIIVAHIWDWVIYMTECPDGSLHTWWICMTLFGYYGSFLFLLPNILVFAALVYLTRFMVWATRILRRNTALLPRGEAIKKRVVGEWLWLLSVGLAAPLATGFLMRSKDIALPDLIVISKMYLVLMYFTRVTLWSIQYVSKSIKKEKAYDKASSL